MAYVLAWESLHAVRSKYILPRLGLLGHHSFGSYFLIFVGHLRSQMGRGRPIDILGSGTHQLLEAEIVDIFE